MKPSGIEWIGDIPDDWEVIKTKFLFNVYGGSTPKVNVPEYWGDKITWITPGELGDDIKIVLNSKRMLSEKGLNSCGATLAPKGSIIISNRAPIGQVCLAGRELCTNQGCKSLVAKIKLSCLFFYYFFKVQSEVLNMLGNGTTFMELSASDLLNFKIPFPPLKTQQKIADYLDEKCGEIDATIAKQKESIEKLKAYKQSLISETVTKGLDKSAPLKPSGIEWIGDIPDDWEVTKISRLYSIQLGKMLQPEKKSSGDTYEPYICAANLSSGTFRLDEVKYMWISEPEKDIYRLKRDDLLVTEGGDVGISSIWKDDISPCYFQNALHRVVPKKGNSNRFLHYWLIVLKSVGYIDLICNKSTIAHFTKEKFAQSLILSIPLQTQEKIADYLDSKCSQIDKYITEKQNIIQKLDAYKKSLIFECVTGKQKI